MACSSRFSEVPVVNVTADNVKELWPSLVLAVKTSTFVALDLELSGLGNRKLLGVRSLPDRYKNLCGVAKTRSVLSLGLSCFRLQKVGQTGISREMSSAGANSDAEVQIKQWSFSVQTFNVILLCSEDFVVEPGALKFLVEHGFDFNKQYSSGISYHRGREKAEISDKVSTSVGPTARQLFDILIWSEVPIVLHNGFVDLVFLYQNFYTELPPSLQVFLADLAEMFPQGILDTKFAVEFVDRLPATYLEYVFRKWQRKNALQASIERREVCLEFGRLPANSAYISICHCSLPSICVERDFIPKASILQELVCLCFAGHGWCASGKQCTKSHAIDLILDLDGAKAAKNRKRRRRQREMQQQQKSEEDVNQSGGDQQNLSTNSSIKRICLNSNTAGDDKRFSESQSGNPDISLVEDTSLADAPEDFHSSPDNVANSQKNCADDIDYDVITDAYLKSSHQLEKGRSGGHRAGFDAFMTGFIMACVLSKHTTVDDTGDRVVGSSLKLSQLSGSESLTNKIYAMGKDQPMTVSKSNFCSPSKNHRDRIQRVRKA